MTKNSDPLEVRACSGSYLSLILETIFIGTSSWGQIPNDADTHLLAGAPPFSTAQAQSDVTIFSAKLYDPDVEDIDSVSLSTPHRAHW